MAHTKAGGSTHLGRDSISKRLGIKMYAGEVAKPGNILVRQRGTKIRPGLNVRRGEDDTLYAVTNGVVQYMERNKTKFTGKIEPVRFVNIVPRAS